MRFLPFALILLLVAGCEPADRPEPIDDDAALENDAFEADEMDDMDDAPEWRANLQGQDGFEAVSGSATAHVMQNRTHVMVNVSGAEADTTHPWHIHSGSCGSGGGIVGDAGAYPALETDADGTASAETNINATLDPGASYHVNVHASPGDMATIVACGDLTQN